MPAGVGFGSAVVADGCMLAVRLCRVVPVMLLPFACPETLYGLWTLDDAMSATDPLIMWTLAPLSIIARTRRWMTVAARVFVSSKAASYRPLACVR